MILLKTLGSSHISHGPLLPLQASSSSHWDLMQGSRRSSRVFLRYPISFVAPNASGSCRNHWHLKHRYCPALGLSDRLLRRCPLSMHCGGIRFTKLMLNMLGCVAFFKAPGVCLRSNPLPNVRATDSEIRESEARADFTHTNAKHHANSSTRLDSGQLLTVASISQGETAPGGSA